MPQLDFSSFFSQLFYFIVFFFLFYFVSIKAFLPSILCSLVVRKKIVYECYQNSCVCLTQIKLLKIKLFYMDTDIKKRLLPKFNNLFLEKRTVEVFVSKFCKKCFFFNIIKNKSKPIYFIKLNFVNS